MKKLIIILSILFLFSGIGYCEEEGGPRLDGIFSSQTKDFETDSIGDVIINQTYSVETKLAWSLDEIDTYLDLYQHRIEMYQKYVDQLKKLRNIIEEKAKKVKLKSNEDKKT